MSERTFTIAVVPWKKRFESKKVRGNGTTFSIVDENAKRAVENSPGMSDVVGFLANLLRITHNAIATAHVTLPLNTLGP